ncbi:MAG: DUF4258 domain-containing protein [Elioraea sp.]|nr:DUF4258 domain-containing protein [Elioraea sp.]
MAAGITRYVLTAHARFETQRRGIGAETIAQVLAAPEQRTPVRPGRDVLQARISLQGKLYLIRVFVDVDHEPAEVVTAYRTSKIGKYWSEQP